MALPNYPAALARVLAHEGGYVNHAKDPGGETNKGVTKRVYDAYRARLGYAKRSVRLIEDDELQAIYRTQYANDVEFDKLPVGVDYVVFDGAVNSGPSQSIKWLQRALGVTADGIVGNVTLQKTASHPNKEALIDAICDQRMKFLRALKTFPTFGKGWTSRVSEVRRVGKQMSKGGAVSIATLTGYADGASAGASGAAPARAADADRPSAPIGGPTAGAGAGVIAVTLQSAKDQLEPLLGASTTIASLYTYLTVALAVVALGGVAYGFYAKQKAARVKAAIGSVT